MKTDRRARTIACVLLATTTLSAGVTMAMAADRAPLAAPAQTRISASQPSTDAVRAAMRQRLPQDEVIYFLLPDRFANGDPSNDHGGYAPDRLVSGYDPTHPDFYHGGDLAGVTQKLDYLQQLGVTTLWLAPIFGNKPVQSFNGYVGAAHHGYWISDFTAVDPHFGGDAAFRALVDAAHARGIKIYLDIVANHTADVIQYRECPDTPCAYRSRADYPETRRGGLDGEPINDGFDGSDYSRLTRTDYAYTPYVPEGEENAKKPAWLNDPLRYHNRGDSQFFAEDSLLGDFAGLDDLRTEDPVVVQGLIDVYGSWIDTYGIDGFRIDTARHVNPEFWQAFVPAMLERARANGIPNFHIFGEVYDTDPAALARFTHEDKLPSVLDFAFQHRATQAASGETGTEALTKVFEADAIYAGGQATAVQLPTFLGNHDMGRIAHFVQKANPQADEAEQLARVKLAHAMMMFSRGVPTLYYGDEQGFGGAGGYANSRQDMWDGSTPLYTAQTPLGGRYPAYSTDAPLYRAIAEMTAIRQSEPTLRRGRQVVRSYSREPGLFALSRLGEDGTEILVLFNTSTTGVTANVRVETSSSNWTSLRGECAPQSTAPASVRVSVPPLDYLVCKSAK